MNFKKKHFKIFDKDYENQFIVYRDEDVEEEAKYINEKLSKLLIHQLLRQINLDELLCEFEAVGFYPSAMWEENSICPGFETGYAFTKDMNSELVEKFNAGNFNQGRTILKVN